MAQEGIIRPAQLRDIPAMLEIYAYYVENTTVSFEYETPSLQEFSGRFARIGAKYPWLVYECGGAVMGYAYADEAFSRTAYGWDCDFSVYVHRGARRCGIGRALYAVLEQAMQSLGYVNAYAVVTGKNEDSKRFHTGCGYVQESVFENTGYKFGQWLDVVWYKKVLNAPLAQMQTPRSVQALLWNGTAYMLKSR